MNKTDWNPNEWQGRSRRQVENNNTIAMIGIGGVLLIVLFLAVASAFHTLFASF